MQQRTRGIALFGAGLLCGLLFHWIPAQSARGFDDNRGGAGGGIAGLGNCPADIAPQPSGDGVVNVDDLLAIINAWGPCPDDIDGDGWSVAEGDCDDNNPAAHPGAPEICNGIDDNCDGEIDRELPDSGGNACASATFLGTLNGDSCNGASINASDALPPGDNDYYRVFVLENSSGDQDLYAQVTLTVPAAATSPLRLCVTCHDCGSTSTTCIDVNPGQTGQLTLRANDNAFGADDSFDALVHVRAVSTLAALCEPYQLTVTCTPGTAQLVCN